MMQKGLIRRSCHLDTWDAGFLECGVHRLFFLQTQSCACNQAEAHRCVHTHTHRDTPTES